jgi:hypothetical protein
MMHASAQIFMQGGLLMWPLVFILLVLAGIALSTVWHLRTGGGNNTAAIQQGLDGLLFWGGFAVIIGVLGTAMGCFKSISAVSKYGLASPTALMVGAAESMVSSIAGLAVLAVAGVCWYVLRWRFLATRRPTTRPGSSS